MFFRSYIMLTCRPGATKKLHEGQVWLCPQKKFRPQKKIAHKKKSPTKKNKNFQKIYFFLPKKVFSNFFFRNKKHFSPENFFRTKKKKFLSKIKIRPQKKPPTKKTKKFPKKNYTFSPKKFFPNFFFFFDKIPFFAHKKKLPSEKKITKNQNFLKFVLTIRQIEINYLWTKWNKAFCPEVIFFGQKKNSPTKKNRPQIKQKIFQKKIILFRLKSFFQISFFFDKIPFFAHK